MNEHYGRIVHDDRIGQLRREAASSHLAAQAKGSGSRAGFGNLSGRVAHLIAGAMSLLVRGQPR